MPRAGNVAGSGLDLRSADGAGVAIGGYLDALASSLVGPGAARAEILTEIGDGLLEAAGTYRSQGLTPDEATRAAIAEFGEPHMVAAAFGPGLGARLARRTALALLASGPLVGLAWIAGAILASLPPARYELSGPWWALPVVGLTLIVGAPSMVLAVAATSRLGLRFCLPASLPPKAAGVASLAAITADSILLAALGVYALMTPAPVSLLPVVPAIAASLARLALAAPALYNCLVTSAALT
jgi:HAAS